MRLERLVVRDLRCIRELDLDPGPNWNLILGPNGAGKTSLLEAAFLLSHGRSFRAGARAALTRNGATGYSVFGEFRDGAGVSHRIGLERAGKVLVSHVGGSPAALGVLLAEARVLCFEPGSHLLVSGAADERRRFMDWGVFHVERGLLELWRRYQRGLRQRNAALRAADSIRDEGIDGWTRDLASTGESLSDLRSKWLERFADPVARYHERLTGIRSPVEVRFDRGWSSEHGLFEAMSAALARDLERGHTSVGPHRADWSLELPGIPAWRQLSRGQEKLVALACTLAQAEVVASSEQDWPVLCIDDLGSELDDGHQRRVIEVLATTPAQLLITGTHVPQGVEGARDRLSVFHVEQGQLVNRYNGMASNTSESAAKLSQERP